MKKFRHLNVPSHWEHYWSKYPEGYTILEALLNWVRQVDDMVDNVNDWNEYLEDFVETFDEKLRPHVQEFLQDMEADGRLADIINQEIFEDLNQEIAGAHTKVDNLINVDFPNFKNKVDEDIKDIRNVLRDVVVFLSEFGAVGNANYFNVTNNKWYADSNITVQSTNDTGAFIEAIEFLKSAGGGVLYLDDNTNFLLNPETEGLRNILHIHNPDNITITSAGRGSIKSEYSTAEHDNFGLRFSYARNFKVSNIDFEMYAHGLEPMSRTNGMILSLTGAGDMTADNENIELSNNTFKIRHTGGATAKKSLYGVMMSGESLRTTRQILIDNNTFDAIGGRNIEFVNCRDIVVKRNRIKDLGADHVGVGFRFLAGCGNVRIYDNIISTMKDNTAELIDVIQIQHGQDNIMCDNFNIHDNTIYVQSDGGFVNCMSIFALATAAIRDNRMIVAHQSIQSRRWVRGILFSDNSVSTTRDIDISGNLFDGITDYCIRNSAPALDNVNVYDNKFGTTYWGIGGRDIADADRMLNVGENYFSLRGRRGTGHDRNIVRTLGAPPSAPDVSYFAGDIVKNETPASGEYMGWICTTTGAPGTWRGYSLIE